MAAEGIVVCSCGYGAWHHFCQGGLAERVDNVQCSRKMNITTSRCGQVGKVPTMSSPRCDQAGNVLTVSVKRGTL